MHFLFILLLHCLVYCQSLLHSFVEIPLISNKLQLPIFTICGQHDLMLDTGSEEVWLADSICQNCYKTTSLCPFLNQNKKQVNYFRGTVSGDHTHLNTCFGNVTVLCVRKVQNMNNIEANGILGIRGKSSGKQFILKYLGTLNVQEKSISLYYGLKESKLFFGQTPQQYKKQKTPLLIAQEWTVRASHLYLENGENMTIDCQVHFDTGSNIVILQKEIYEKVATVIKDTMEKHSCFQKSKELQFQCYTYGFDLNQNITFELEGQSRKKASFNLNLRHLISISKGLFSFKIQKTDKDICVMGLPAFKDYLISFTMNGPLKIYKSKSQELSVIQEANYRLILFQYILVFVVLAFVGIKAESLIEETIDRKTVI